MSAQIPLVAPHRPARTAHDPPPAVVAVREARLAREMRTPAPATVAQGDCSKGWGVHRVGVRDGVRKCLGCGARA